MLFDGKAKPGEESAAGAIYATQSGYAYPIEQMPDAVFADKILGDGVCIVPCDRRVYSPVDGMVANVSEKGYAFNICACDNAEVLVHIGVDTVKLPKGAFSPLVRAGQTVRRGELICLVDIQAIERAGLATHTAVVVDTRESIVWQRMPGKTKGGKTIIFYYQNRNDTTNEQERKRSDENAEQIIGSDATRND